APTGAAVRSRHARDRIVPDLRAGLHPHRRWPGRRHAHRGPASLRDRLPELLPLRFGHRHGLGAVHDHPRVLAAAVPPAPRPHGVLMGAPTAPASARSRADRSVEATGRAGSAAARRRLIQAAVMFAVAVLWLLPAVWVLVTSLKRAEDIIRMPPEWIPWPPTLE